MADELIQNQQVEETGLRFSRKAWQDFQDFVTKPENFSQFYPDIQPYEISEQQAHELTVRFLNRFWRPDQIGTAIVENITLGEQPRYRIRPPGDGAFLAGYGCDNGGIPAFICTLRDGYFIALGFENGYYDEDSGSGELVLLGPVYVQTPLVPGEETRPPRPLPAQVVANITNLKSKRSHAADMLSRHLECIDWLLGIVRKRQFGLRYNSVEADESNYCLYFTISSPQELWKKLKDMKSVDISAVALSGSKNPEQWDPVENTRCVSLGEFTVPRKQIGHLLSSNRDAEGLLTDTIEIQLDPDMWDKVSGMIAAQGFLVNDIFKAEIPLKRERQSIERVIAGDVANPRLIDFFFDGTKARTPDIPVLQLDDSDLQHLRSIVENLELNKEQELAIAKLLAAPELAIIQGPPGTGKTKVLAYGCALLVKRGEKLMITSQSNTAIDKIFSDLPQVPQLRPRRIGGEKVVSDFTEDKVVCTWLSWVREACRKILTAEEKLAADIEEIERVWPYFADMVNELGRLKKALTSAEKKIRTTDGKLTTLNNTLANLKNKSSLHLASLGAVKQTLKQLNNESAITDLADWVKQIDSSQRPGILGPLKGWRQDNPLPETVQKLLAGPQPNNSDNQEQADVIALSRIGRLWLKFRGFFIRKPKHIQQPEESQQPGEELEPNWAVLWIDLIALLNRLLDFQSILPGVVDSCTELERLCVAAKVSKVPAETWSKATAELDHVLKSSGQPIAGIAALADIAASLHPKKKFLVQLAKVRSLIQKALIDIPPLTASLQKILTEVAEDSVKYLNNLLAENDKQLQKTRVLLNSAKCKQADLVEAEAKANEQIKQLGAAWAEAVNSLPDGLRAQIGDDPIPIGRGGLETLKDIRNCFETANQERLGHHELWGPVQHKWVNLLENPTETDNRKMLGTYCKKSNAVGITCSWSANKAKFLNREEFAKFFDYVLSDEVSKAKPSEILMAARLARRLALVGDHRQLTPVFREGRKYDRPFAELEEVDPDFEKVRYFEELVTASLFKKLYHECLDVLKQYFIIEYRFHLQILELINQFYDIPLQCGIKDPDKECDHGLVINTGSGNFLNRNNHVLWVDTGKDHKGRWAYEQQAGNSKINRTEAKAVCRPGW